MKNHFLGSWRLVSSSFKTDGHEKRYPLGQRVSGILHYDASGHMAAQLYGVERPVFIHGDLARGSDAEIRRAFTTSLCYYGSYAVNETDGEIVHHVEGCTFPNWVGQPQARFYRFEGDSLALTTPAFEIDGVMQIGELLWQRLA